MEQSDPWNDSALLNAFDDAITKFKKMHKKEHCRRDNSKQPETVAIESSEVHDETITPAATTFLLSSNDADTDPPVFEQSNGALDEGSTNTQELLKQYYELEEQRQALLQRLQQAGYWDNHYSDQLYAPSGVYSTDKQTSHPTLVSSCCPCVYPCSSSSMPACSFSGRASFASTNLDPRMQDDTIFKTAMGAAEQAMSSMNLNASTTSNPHQGSSEGQVAQSISPQKDLAVVLNAWYSAGFHTAKYLFEQSISK